MLLDLEAMARTRLGIRGSSQCVAGCTLGTAPGAGTIEMADNAAGIQPVAAGKWFTGTRPRRSNLTTLHRLHHQPLPGNATQDELLDYLTGGARRTGCECRTGEERVVPATARACTNRGDVKGDAAAERSDHSDPDHLTLWTKVVVRQPATTPSRLARTSRTKTPCWRPRQRF